MAQKRAGALIYFNRAPDLVLIQGRPLLEYPWALHYNTSLSIPSLHSRSALIWLPALFQAIKVCLFEQNPVIILPLFYYATCAKKLPSTSKPIDTFCCAKEISSWWSVS